MAYHHRNHFVDPNHLLTETEYNDKSTHTCNICLLELVGLTGYYCDDCDTHIHKACADHFEKFVSFFADRHRLKLIRTPGGHRVTHMCDLCKEDCPPASFVYRCDECDFDLHPLCSLLPETIESPIHPGHHLRMITSPSVSCSACHERLPLWHYVCSCSVNFKLHIACAMDMDEPAGAKDHGGSGPGIQGSYGAADQRGFGSAGHQGSYSYGAVDQRGFGSAGFGNNFVDPAVMIQSYSPFFQGFLPNVNVPGYVPGIPSIYGTGIPVYVPAPGIPGFGPSVPGMYGPPIPSIYSSPIQGIYGPAIPGQNTVSNKPSRCSTIAKFLLKQSFGVAISVATGGILGSPMIDLLSALNN